MRSGRVLAYFVYTVMMFPMFVKSQGMGTCSVTSTIDVSLSSSFQQEGRAFACPGELVTFICEVNQSTSMQIAAEPFICRADPVVYLATDPVGSPGGTSSTDTFQAKLTNVQRESGTLMAYYNTTLKTTVTDQTANTMVECSNELTSSNIQRKSLNQSEIPTPPPGLNHRLESRNCTCAPPEIGSIAVTCACRVTELLLFWEEARGKFDVECYVVTVSPVAHNLTSTISPDICNMASDIMTTKSMSFIYRILPGVNYSVLVRTVSKCGQLSSPAMLQEEDGFVSIDEQLVMVTLPGPAILNMTIISSPLTQSNIVLTGIGGALLTLATFITLLRLCLFDEQRRLYKCLFGIERVLRIISLLMVVITVFLLLLYINEPCDEVCERTSNTTTALFFIFAFFSATMTVVITVIKCTPQGKICQLQGL